MKKYPWLVVALVLASSFAGPVAADTSHAQQDQAFVHQLVQSISPVQAPTSPVLTDSPAPFAPPSVYCSGFYCYTDTDCWAHCIGGDGASFCNRALHNCVPY